MKDFVLCYPVMFTLFLVAVFWILSKYDKKQYANCKMCNSYVTDWYKDKKEDIGFMNTNNVCRVVIEKIFGVAIPKKSVIKYGTNLIDFCPKKTLLYNGEITKNDTCVVFDLHPETGINFYILYSKTNISKYKPSDDDTESLNIIYSIIQKDLIGSLKTYIKNSTEDRKKLLPIQNIKGYIGLIGNKIYIERDGQDLNGIQLDFLSEKKPRKRYP